MPSNTEAVRLCRTEEEATQWLKDHNLDGGVFDQHPRFNYFLVLIPWKTWREIRQEDWYKTGLQDPHQAGVGYRLAQVEACDVVDFLARYYKPDRYTERGEEYALNLTNSYQTDVDLDGYCMISEKDSVNGWICTYYPAIKWPAQFGKPQQDRQASFFDATNEDLPLFSSTAY